VLSDVKDLASAVYLCSVELLVCDAGLAVELVGFVWNLRGGLHCRVDFSCGATMSCRARRLMVGM